MDPHEPLSFRFVVQPFLALLLGLRDGRRDAAQGLPPYALSLLTGRSRRKELLQQGLKTVALPLSVAVAMDGLVQWMVSQRILFWQAVVVGIALIGLPYVISRGLSQRIAARVPRPRKRRHAWS